MAGPTTARSTGSARSSRGLWNAVMASLSAMTLAFVALLVVELSHFADSSAPMVVVADADGVAGTQRVTLTKEQVEDDETPSVTVRVRNDSTSPVSVSAALEGGAHDQGGSMTAALTAEGAVVRSGPLDSLRVSDFMLAASSTTPVTIDFEMASADIADAWEGNGDLVLVITTH